ncbi:TAXI family TRAP transporter solute-binding subunit [Nesterenkonia ebinurensis]|uniref:TAXI family TRAP transporter solute-binding subunit n=1 Tax=Nesterenkonia ebinurensis TaxID=2608252 RepID=UPI00123D4AAC|nr:TAXI family TRAP transporter solute-binding subunit [Nesterenkonia ebinurensis]
MTLFHYAHRITALALLGLLSLSSCGEDAGENANGDSDADLDSPIDLSMATLDQGSGWYNYGVSIGQALESDLPSGSGVEVLPYAGSIGNPELVTTGEADFATTFSAVAAWAYVGEEGTPFEEEPFEDLRILVGGIDQYYFGPIAPANAPFDSIEEIAEDQMALDLVSQPRGSLGDVGTNLILQAHGASVSDIESWGGSFEPTSTDVASNAIRDNNADLWIQAINDGHPNITELAQTSDIKFLEISESAIEYLNDFGLEGAVLPAESFVGQDEDVQLVGFTTAIVAGADLDDDIAYAITQSIIENAEQLKEANASMATFDPELAFTDEMTAGVPLHPGAEQYYRDAGLME